MINIFQYLESIHPLPEGLPEHLERVLKKKTLSRREYLLRAGQVCRSIYFIEKGLLRCYAVQGTTEVCSWFMKEGDICISVESFFRQQYSHENIQALENAEVQYMNYEELQHIYKEYPDFNYTARVLTEKYYLLSEQRLLAMRMRRSHERYAWMMEYFPELLQRVPAKYIASYLGITEVMLSTIKGRR